MKTFQLGVENLISSVEKEISPCVRCDSCFNWPFFTKFMIYIQSDFLCLL